MSWSRAPVATALAGMVRSATAGSVYVHETPPEVLNPPAVVIMRPVTVAYSTAYLGIDDVQLPLAIVGGIEQDDAIDALKSTVRQAVEADSSLAGVVQKAWPIEERNWRNVTGAGGIQLLYVELVLQITM
jgi:hypothetical protein